MVCQSVRVVIGFKDVIFLSCFNAAELKKSLIIVLLSIFRSLIITALIDSGQLKVTKKSLIDILLCFLLR